MAFSENLQYLRKKHNLTQEQFADEFQVSRQAVSKWETGDAFPETEKLIAMCDRFGVTLDTLVRGDVAAGESALCGDDCGAEYKSRLNNFSLMISLGVMFILTGVAVCVILGGLSEIYGEIYAVFGGAAVLTFVAVAVFMFIYGCVYSNCRCHRRGR